jgi:hypothetical protein
VIRAYRAVTTLLVALAVTACTDTTTAPTEPGEVRLQLSVTGPQLVSPAETEALSAAFDLVDRYDYEVVDSATTERVATGSADITPGSPLHALDISVPEAAVGRTVQITLVAFDGALELYRSVVYAVLSGDLGTISVDAEIRYTGPGIRGTVRTDGGDPVGGVSLQLIRNQSAVGTATTEDDGTYLFVGLTAGTYQVVPAAPSGSAICPGLREVTLAGTDEAIVTDFRTQADTCTTKVLVMSGGDFDDTGAVAAFLGGEVSTFFYVNQLPTLEYLRQFDVVMLFMNGIFDESASLGNRVAEYVNVGGNVVLSSFYFQGRSDAGTGSVGWGTLEGIDPFDATPGGATYEPVVLETIQDPSHPIMSGVSVLESTSFSSGVVARSGTTVLATWSDGAPLVGFRRGSAGQRIVGVSLFPAATGTVTGDAETLWNNAVSWAGAICGPS